MVVELFFEPKDPLIARCSQERRTIVERNATNNYFGCVSADPEPDTNKRQQKRTELCRKKDRPILISYTIHSMIITKEKASLTCKPSRVKEPRVHVPARFEKPIARLKFPYWLVHFRCVEAARPTRRAPACAAFFPMLKSHVCATRTMWSIISGYLFYFFCKVCDISIIYAAAKGIFIEVIWGRLQLL